MTATDERRIVVVYDVCGAWQLGVDEDQPDLYYFIRWETGMGFTDWRELDDERNAGFYQLARVASRHLRSTVARARELGRQLLAHYPQMHKLKSHADGRFLDAVVLELLSLELAAPAHLEEAVRELAAAWREAAAGAELVMPAKLAAAVGAVAAAAATLPDKASTES